MLRRFINCILPVYTCNLECSYCYVHQAHLEKGRRNSNLDPELIRKAFSVERIGKSFVNLCGNGESLFLPAITDVVRVLLENGHIVGVVSNITITKKIDELCLLPIELRKHLFIKASFHYMQLKQKRLIDVYFENIKKLHNSGISYSMEIVADDQLVDSIDDIIQIFKDHEELMPQVIESREVISGAYYRLTNKDIDRHIAAWGKFNSDLFDGMQPFWGEKRDEFCYAGEYSCTINLETGLVTQCERGKPIQNIYKNIDEPLHFCAIGKNCHVAHCYISYVWQRLCGNIRELKHSPYYLTRNRTYLDGTEWLSPDIKEEWSVVIGENCGYYSKNKEKIVSGLMDALYKGPNRTDGEDTEAVVEWFMKRLSDYPSEAVAIWGYGNIGNYLYNVLNDYSNFKVSIVIDRYVPHDDNEFRFISSDAALNGALYECNIQLLILTPLIDASKIEKEISMIYGKNIKVINIFSELMKGQ